ncbi:MULTISPECIES: hypothetical protein, partial [unclassified Bradyrhizobium]|uniref:hypothetical protein n=1 Tax=unclassified Bradyrhizobium TaxID=2631580 RepID=UPI00339094A0
GFNLPFPAISNRLESEKETPAQSLRTLFTDDYLHALASAGAPVRCLMIPSSGFDMGWLLRNAVDESLAFVAGCDREPVDVVLGPRAQLWKWVRSVGAAGTPEQSDYSAYLLASMPPPAVARSQPLSYQNSCTSFGF